MPELDRPNDLAALLPDRTATKLELPLVEQRMEVHMLPARLKPIAMRPLSSIAADEEAPDRLKILRESIGSLLR